MKLHHGEELYQKLKLTKIIAESNVENAMRKAIELKNRLEEVEKEIEEHLKTLAAAQKRLDDFMNSHQPNSNFFKENC
jgi:hypothetical protein